MFGSNHVRHAGSTSIKDSFKTIAIMLKTHTIIVEKALRNSSCITVALYEFIIARVDVTGLRLKYPLRTLTTMNIYIFIMAISTKTVV